MPPSPSERQGAAHMHRPRAENGPYPDHIRDFNMRAEVIAKIKDMTVRGAPAIGVAGAFGIVLAVNASTVATA